MTMVSPQNVAMLAMCALSVSVSASPVKLTDFEFGEEFSKCIKVEDWNTKGPGEDIEVADRDSTSGCCPDGFTYGSSSNSGIEYQKGMVLCGFNDDGTHKGITTGTNCDYGKCFVVRTDVTCKDDAQMTINGCCESGQFPDDCVNSGSSSSNDMKTCTNYKKVGSSWENLGSTTDANAMADGKLQWGTSVGGDGVYNYGLCGATGGGGEESSEDTSGAIRVSAIATIFFTLVSKALI